MSQRPPYGMDQHSPFTDQPDPSNPNGRPPSAQPLQAAITGRPTYPADPTYLDWMSGNRIRPLGGSHDVPAPHTYSETDGTPTPTGDTPSITNGPVQSMTNTPPATPPVQLPGNHAPTANYYRNVPAPDAHVNDLIRQFVQQQHLTANQNDPASLNAITNYLRSQGIGASTDYTDVNGHTGGIVVDGHPYQLIDGNNNWTNLQAWPEGDGGAPAASFFALHGQDNTDPTFAQYLQWLQSLAHPQS